MTKRREADKLDTSEHGREVKRMRAYSTDEPEESDDKKRRTRSDVSVTEWRQQQQITVSDDKAPEPFREFSQTPFGTVIQQALTRAGFTKPTAIQAQAWSIGVTGQDMISIAKTGSGTCGSALRLSVPDKDTSFRKNMRFLATSLSQATPRTKPQSRSSPAGLGTNS